MFAGKAANLSSAGFVPMSGERRAASGERRAIRSLCLLECHPLLPLCVTVEPPEMPLPRPVAPAPSSSSTLMISMARAGPWCLCSWCCFLSL
ncbi:hypothetical protein EYF80_046176 [Liparis tanakae]|uniref:Uncharacterized protein n=1 Tax=Liparis tanakae TaxID=230148 RepID=A0A4Z2FTD0_9TELE|nr:hypothetical protein EYF80_046176 [Liparis tanakae]